PGGCVRLWVLSEVLGYEELYRVHRSDGLRRDIHNCSDYLIPRFAQVRSGTSFDGMLGTSMLDAFEVTGDSLYLDYGRQIVNELLALSDYETILNGGLMAALALADEARLT